jgi:hypothetical protein
MDGDYLHIRNVYAQKSRIQSEQALIIETDLALPETGHLSADPQFDTLLAEIYDLKHRHPELFRAVDTVEIREAADHAWPPEDEFAFTHVHPVHLSAPQPR